MPRTKDTVTPECGRDRFQACPVVGLGWSGGFTRRFLARLWSCALMQYRMRRRRQGEGGHCRKLFAAVVCRYQLLCLELEGTFALSVVVRFGCGCRQGEGEGGSRKRAAGRLISWEHVRRGSGNWIHARAGSTEYARQLRAPVWLDFVVLETCGNNAGVECRQVSPQTNIDR